MATGDIRFTRPLLSMADAARELGLARETFRRWARGYPRGGPLLHINAARSNRQANVPFIAMAEAWVLEGLRRAGVRPHRIRPALEELQREFGREYVLASRELATDGISVLWDFSRTQAGAGLIEAATGQHVMREIVADYLQYVSWDIEDDKYPTQLSLKAFEPTKVVINAFRSAGQPVVAGSGAKVANIAAMLKAGEDLASSQKSTASGSTPYAPPRASSWAAPPEFYLDENAVTRTVRRLLTDLGYAAHTPAELFGTGAEALGADDTEWLARVAQRGWVVLNRDAIALATSKRPEVWRITQSGVERFGS
jgi:hypothetical protein